MHVIAGLGNPGDEHRNQRHNVGFMAVDAIAQRHGFPPFRSKFNALISDGTVDGERVLLIKPQTYMNRSGDAVAPALNFYKLTPAEMTVIYDELDLTPGKVRVKTGGGNGGHNGLRSIDAAVGKDYQRVRIGIGHPGHKDLVTRHVLGDFAKADGDWLRDLLDAIADNAALLARKDGPNFMNRLALLNNGAPEPRIEAKPAPAKGQSHIRQARQNRPQAKVPDKGPMADMLRKLFSKDE